MFNLLTELNTFELSMYSGMKLTGLVFSAPAAVYFLVIALKKDPYKKPTAMFGFCVVLWSAANLMGEYFSVETPMNDPVRIIHQLSYIVIMLFFIYDAAHSADIHKPVQYQFFGYLAIIFISLSSIPAIVLNQFNLKPFTINMMSCYVEFCLLLFVICRMVSIKKPSQTEVIREDIDINEK